MRCGACDVRIWWVSVRKGVTRMVMDEGRQGHLLSSPLYNPSLRGTKQSRTVQGELLIFPPLGGVCLVVIWQGGVYTPLQRPGITLKPLPTPSRGRESRYASLFSIDNQPFTQSTTHSKTNHSPLPQHRYFPG